jgi:hypothetical protein
MLSSIGLARTALIYAACLVVAVAVGFMLTAPNTYTSLGVFGLLAFVLAFPLLAKWHHALLILTWNASISLFFLPGQPTLGMVMALVSFSLTVLDYSMGRRRLFLSVPALAWPLLYLAAVVLVTAQATGGVGFRLFGSGVYGGKRYFYILLAIVAYLALIARPIRREHALLAVSAFFLSGLTSMVSNVVYLLGPSAYFVLALFPAEGTFNAMRTGSEMFVRFTGVSWATLAVCYWLLLRFGVRGLLDPSRPWRLALFGTMFGLSMLGGFRAIPIGIMTVFVCQFVLEGLHRTRLLPAVILSALLLGILSFPFIDRMPLTVQRSLSFLPVNVERVVSSDAQATVAWRLDMWRILWSEVPRYLWLGKGFAMGPSDQYLAEEGVRRGLYQATEPALLSGNFHNGPLTLLIPFGIWGALGFLWLSAAGIWVLHRNRRYGDPALKNINCFLMALLLTRLGTFYTYYGDFSTDMLSVVAYLGLSVSLNGGVCRPPGAAVEADATESGDPGTAPLPGAG